MSDVLNNLSLVVGSFFYNETRKNGSFIRCLKRTFIWLQMNSGCSVFDVFAKMAVVSVGVAA